MQRQSSLGIRILIITGIVMGAASMVGLGFWQLARLRERRTHNAEIAARLAQPPWLMTGAPLSDTMTLEYRPARARGVYDFSQEIVLRNQAHDQVPGVDVITPLRITGSDTAVLVDRGWIPYEQAAPEVRAAYHVPEGEVEVEGILRRSQARASVLLPADPTPSPDRPRLDAWYWLEIDQIQRQVPYPLLSMFIEQAPRPGAEAPQLPISGYEIDLSEGPHLSYAIQWFSFAAILVFGSLAYYYQHRRKPRGA